MKFSLPSGTTGFVNERNEWITTGSQMGRRSMLPEQATAAPVKLRMVRLPFVDGAYDRWGAYWGAPANVWCAVGSNLHGDFRVFVRGDSREEAKAKVLNKLPLAKFYR